MCAASDLKRLIPCSDQFITIFFSGGDGFFLSNSISYAPISIGWRAGKKTVSKLNHSNAVDRIVWLANLDE